MAITPPCANLIFCIVPNVWIISLGKILLLANSAHPHWLLKFWKIKFYRGSRKGINLRNRMFFFMILNANQESPCLFICFIHEMVEPISGSFRYLSYWKKTWSLNSMFWSNSLIHKIYLLCCFLILRVHMTFFVL